MAKSNKAVNGKLDGMPNEESKQTAISLQAERAKLAKIGASGSKNDIGLRLAALTLNTQFLSARFGSLAVAIVSDSMAKEVDAFRKVTTEDLRLAVCAELGI